jgi:hypothetical protein
LYDGERGGRDRKLSAEDRRALRQARSRPILNDIHEYLEADRPKRLPESPEGQAIAYELSNCEALVRYSEDGDLKTDNNGAEHSPREVGVGWTAAVLSSLIATPKRLRIDPFAYLHDVFARIAAHLKNRLQELLPDNWKAIPPADTF